MKLMCDRGHLSDGLVGDRCITRLASKAECGEKLMRPPELNWCDCGRGLYSDGNCSFCGKEEAPHGDDFGCVLCGQWFPTLEGWQEHVYGSDSATFEAEAHGHCDPQKVAEKALVSGRKRSQSGMASRRRRDRERKRRQNVRP